MSTIATGPAEGALQRARGVEVIGEMAGSGYRHPPSLVRRVDGQVIQLTPLLHAILRAIDGLHGPSDVAAAVSESTGRTVTGDNVRHLVDNQLRPLGLLALADGSEPQVKKRNPLLGLRLRYAVTRPEQTRKFTDPFQFLFRPWMAIPILTGFMFVCWWVFFDKGLAKATWDAFERPGLLILVFAITIVSAGFHEFGHAAAARYGGATPGAMGFGVYLVWPAFYTDVTDSYRLGRAGRLRTDLGGLYFNAIVAVAIIGFWWWLRYDALLLVVATQILQMLRQLAPTVRFDGYHIVADLTGVPDLYSRMKPTLLGALPWRWGDPEARMLKPWARIVVTVWVMVVVPLLLCTLATAVLALPRVVGSAWAGLGKQQRVLAHAWADGDMIQSVARVLAMVAIIIPVAGVMYLLVRLGRSTSVSAWRATAGKPVMRMAAVLCGAALLGAIGYAWWPHAGNYRPIQPTERGTVFDIALMPSVHSTASVVSHRTVRYAPRPMAASTLVEGKRGVMRAVWDMRTPRPTKASPRLAFIMVPRRMVTVGSGGPSLSPVAAAPARLAGDRGWVFPVDKPLVPGPGDNQSLAVNTTDGTVVYDTAFALVWVTDNADAMNINDAEAYASCRNCGAVAVAYQVVFVVDTDPADNNVVAPQNLAGALNYKCVNCLTFGLARQLFITLDQPLSADAQQKLSALWTQIDAYGNQIEAGRVRLEQIGPTLAGYSSQIVAIVEQDQQGAAWSETGSQTTTATHAPVATATPTPSATATPVATTRSPTPSPTPTASPTLTPTSGTTSAPTTSSGATPTATSVASPSPSSPTESNTSSPTGTASGTTSGSTATANTNTTDTARGTTSSGGTTSGGTTP